MSRTSCKIHFCNMYPSQQSHTSTSGTYSFSSESCCTCQKWWRAAIINGLFYATLCTLKVKYSHYWIFQTIFEIILLRFCYCHFSYKFYKRIYELSTSMKYNTTDIFHYWYSFKQNIAMYWYKTRMNEFIYYVTLVTWPIAVMLLVCRRAPSVNN